MWTARYAALAALVLAAGAVAQSAGDGGLAASYTLDAGGGLTVFDVSGNGLDGAVVGARFRPSPRGYALVFDGTDDRVDFGSPAGLHVVGDLSLSVWVRTDARQRPKTERLMFGDTTAAAVGRNYSLRLDSDDQLRFDWGDGRSTQHLAVKAAQLDGRWRHLAVTCDHGRRRATLYVDGETVATVPLTVPIGSPAPNPIRMGCWRDGNAFAGEIDDLRLYRRALTPAEVTRLYRSASCPAAVGKAEEFNAEGLLVRHGFGAAPLLAALSSARDDLLQAPVRVEARNAAGRLAWTAASRLHAAGFQVVPYLIGFLLSDMSPEYRDVRSEMLIAPRRTFPITHSPPGFQLQDCGYACRRVLWQDWSVATATLCLAEYDIDGVYLDGTCMPAACMNETHGCGYRSAGGRLHPRFPVKAEAENCYASHWRREGAGLLVVVANLGKTATSVPVRFARNERELDVPLQATAALSGEVLPATRDTVTLRLEPQGWALVRVR